MPITPGFTTVRLMPKPNWELRRLDCRYCSAAGEWAVRWQCVDADTLTLAVAVPFGCTAELTLPNWNGETTDNPVFTDVQNGVCRLQPGRYEVTYKTAVPMFKPLSTANTTALAAGQPRSQGTAAENDARHHPAARTYAEPADGRPHARHGPCRRGCAG
ncbi:alpha-L-rhamnosidase C-terminal domain-containing protein [Gemmiger sp.]